MKLPGFVELQPRGIGTFRYSLKVYFSSIIISRRLGTSFFFSSTGGDYSLRPKLIWSAFRNRENSWVLFRLVHQVQKNGGMGVWDRCASEAPFDAAVTFQNMWSVVSNN